MPIRFDQPALLLLALLAIPMVLVGWHAMRGQDALRRTAAALLRTLLIALLALMLAGPRTLREHDQLTVIGLLDVSGSIRRFAELPPVEDLASSNVEALRRWFREATDTRADDDRFGLVVFDGRAAAISVPTTGDYIDDALDVRLAEGTNIAEAIELGLAMFPADTARRLVLVTDGNETLGDAITATRGAAGGAIEVRSGSTIRVPIDVLPITYRVKRDVRVVRLEAPPNAQPGQTVTVRVLMEATDETAGRLTLRREGRIVDLNGDEPGGSRAVIVPEGQSVHLAQVPLLETPVNRFEATFEPLRTEDDTLTDNNRAEAFTVTPSKGRTLVVDPREPGQPGYLATVLRDAGMPVDSRSPSRLPDDLLGLQRYDLVVLDNVAAYELSLTQQQMLSRHVHDLGGGLIMAGGPTSFGAGGWNGTAIEQVLPLEMDPPKSMLLPQAALVLVLDKSGSMNRGVAGARASQQEVANEAAALAIESLRGRTLVGVISFDVIPRVRVPLQPVDDHKAIADQVRGITAEGGTNIAPALKRAYEMLRDVDVDRKRVVCLSDGESPTSGLDALAQRMADANIRLTTIAVGDDADEETLQRLAELGGGEFYSVRDPRKLPRILVDSVQVLNQPLLKDVPFVPVVLPTGSTLTAGMDDAPILDGLVITSPREDPTVVIEMTHPEGEPLLAHWQAGLGRAAAFTSDARGHWSRRWLEWPGAAAFWTQLARMTARPSVDLRTELRATIEEDRLHVVFEASAPEGRFLDYLQVTGTVYGPGGEPTPLRLRQTAPGRYEGDVPAVASGNYIVALSPRQGERRLAPAIGGASKAMSPEFRRLESNVGLLQQLVELTRGRLLRFEEPRSVDLFDREGMPTSISALPAWRSIAWIVLAIMLLDVAARRIAWDAARLRALVARAFARFRPATRGEVVTATLSSLREVSDRVDAHLERDRVRSEAASASEPPGEAVASAPSPAADAAAEPSAPPAEPEPARPDSRQVRAALDALLGRRAGPTSPDDSDDETTAPAEEKEAEPGETTSSLLAAKRRARRRLGGD